MLGNGRRIMLGRNNSYLDNPIVDPRVSPEGASERFQTYVEVGA